MFYTKIYKPETSKDKNPPKYIIFPVYFHNKGLDFAHTS